MKTRENGERRRETGERRKEMGDGRWAKGEGRPWRWCETETLKYLQRKLFKQNK